MFKNVAAVVFVIDAWVGLEQTDIDLIEQLKVSAGKNILFVVNRIDVVKEGYEAVLQTVFSGLKKCYPFLDSDTWQNCSQFAPISILWLQESQPRGIEFFGKFTQKLYSLVKSQDTIANKLKNSLAEVCAPFQYCTRAYPDFKRLEQRYNDWQKLIESEHQVKDQVQNLLLEALKQATTDVLPEFSGMVNGRATALSRFPMANEVLQRSHQFGTKQCQATKKIIRDTPHKYLEFDYNFIILGAIDSIQPEWGVTAPEQLVQDLLSHAVAPEDFVKEMKALNENDARCGRTATILTNKIMPQLQRCMIRQKELVEEDIRSFNSVKEAIPNFDETFYLSAFYFQLAQAYVNSFLYGCPVITPDRFIQRDSQGEFYNTTWPKNQDVVAKILLLPFNNSPEHIKVFQRIFAQLYLTGVAFTTTIEQGHFFIIVSPDQEDKILASNLESTFPARREAEFEHFAPPAPQQYPRISDFTLFTV